MTKLCQVDSIHRLYIVPYVQLVTPTKKQTKKKILYICWRKCERRKMPKEGWKDTVNTQEERKSEQRKRRNDDRQKIRRRWSQVELGGALIADLSPRREHFVPRKHQDRLLQSPSRSLSDTHTLAVYKTAWLSTDSERTSVMLGSLFQLG